MAQRRVGDDPKPLPMTTVNRMLREYLPPGIQLGADLRALLREHILRRRSPLRPAPSFPPPRPARRLAYMARAPPPRPDPCCL